MSAAEPARLWQGVEPGPVVGFAAAAGAAITELNRQVPGWDLWLVTCVSQDRQLVIASAGAWAEQAPRGAQFSWQASFCVRMTSGQGPAIAGDVRDSPAYLKAAIGPLAGVRAYLGVPLLLGAEELFGTLCAFAGEPRPELPATMATVRLLARMLSTVLAGERAAAERSAEAAGAYALADRDRVTGLRNRRGFEQMLTLEQGRCRRFAIQCSVVVLRVPDGAAGKGHDPGPGGQGEARLRRYAEILEQESQPGDVIARVEPNEYTVLAVHTDLIGAHALAAPQRPQRASFSPVVDTRLDPIQRSAC
jgi:GGDEF domain-containing protein